MKEAELKKAVADYLTLGMNQGKWYFDRLNSGRTLAVYNGAQRMINMCRPGTADFMVFAKNGLRIEGCPHLLFLELKGDKGRQSAEQKDFANQVERHGAEYHLIKSLDELMMIL